MEIDDPYCLQIGINDDGPHKLYALAFQRFGSCILQF